MEQLLTAGPWGAIGGLILVVIILLKKKNTQPDCPVVEGGGTPMRQEDHDKLCDQKTQLVFSEIEHVKEAVIRVENKVDDLPRKINGKK